MTNTTIISKLIKLGYSEPWLVFDILSISDFDEQLREFDKGDDVNSEHYRYKTFYNYLEKHDLFPNNVVEHLIDLLKNDADQTMASSASIKLLKHEGLTKEQFNTVQHFVMGFGEWVNAHVKKPK